MSARRFTPNGFSLLAEPEQTRLNLSSDSIQFRKNGIEFRSERSLTLWKELTINLHSPGLKKVRCNGVVVACHGNRHQGYNISVLFLHLSRHAQAAFDVLAESRLA